MKPRFQQSHRGGHGGGSKSHRVSDQTLAEVHYLKQLIEKQIPVCVKLRNNEEVRGVVEYYDVNFIRLTRQKAPNLFIFKHEIKYLFEEGRPGTTGRSQVSEDPSPEDAQPPA